MKKIEEAEAVMMMVELQRDVFTFLIFLWIE